MRRAYFISVIVAVVSLAQAQDVLPGGQIFEMDPIRYDGPTHIEDEIVVKFKPGVSENVIADLNRANGTSVISTSPFAGFKRLRIPSAVPAQAMANIFSKNPNVEYAELNHIAYALMVPTDPLYRYQWHLDNPVYGGIGMEEAWNLSSGASVVVAVVDTGVADPPSGDDLDDGRVVPGYDFINNDSDPTDDNGHGTHVAGTIAQSTNNGIGVAGVAYSCSVMPVKVLNRQGSGSYTAIADGIYWAADHEADVINMSLGGSSGSTTLENALAYAYNKGVTIICASGNDGSYQVSYPAAYDAYCIAVGATAYDEQVAGYSNRGSSLDLTAPGGDSRDMNGDGYIDGVLQQTFQTRGWGYYFFTGTSMAAPHVSGVAALLISKGVATTPNAVRQALQSTAEDKGSAGWDPEYGHGIVNAYAALQWGSVPTDNPPFVVITTPPNGATVSGTVTVTAVAGDDKGVTQVEFFVDGAPIGADTDGSDGWSMAWDTTAYTDGPHTLAATATDTIGQMDSDAIGVTVFNSSSLGIMHVADIGMGLNTRTVGKKNKFTKAVATVRIADASGNPVNGATVYGSWSKATSDSDYGVTNASGEVVLSSDEVRNAPSGTIFTFTVTDVVKSGWTYNSAANIETSDSIPVP